MYSQVKVMRLLRNISDGRNGPAIHLACNSTKMLALAYATWHFSVTRRNHHSSAPVSPYLGLKASASIWANLKCTINPTIGLLLYQMADHPLLAIIYA